MMHGVIRDLLRNDPTILTMMDTGQTDAAVGYVKDRVCASQSRCRENE